MILKNSVHQLTVSCWVRRGAGSSNCTGQPYGNHRDERTYVDRMFITFNDQPEHLPSFVTLFFEQLVSQTQKCWKGHQTYLIEIASRLTSLEAVCATYREQALNTSQN